MCITGFMLAGQLLLWHGANANMQHPLRCCLQHTNHSQHSRDATKDNNVERICISKPKNMGLQLSSKVAPMSACRLWTGNGCFTDKALAQSIAAVNISTHLCEGL